MSEDLSFDLSPEFRLFSGGLLQQFSPSMGDTLRRCDAQAAFRYIQGIKKKPQRFFAVGIGADDGTRHGWTEKSNGRKVKTAAVVEKAVASYEEQVGKGIDFEGLSEAECVAEDKDRIARTLGAFWPERGDKLRVSTEIPPQTAITVDTGRTTVKAIIDVVEEDRAGKLHVWDFKTAQKKWYRGKERESLQGYYYPWALSTVTKRPVVGMGYLVAASNARTPTIEDRLLPNATDPAVISRIPKITEVFARRYEDLLRSGGVGVPVWSGRVCSWCGYRDECRQTYGVEPPGGNRDDC